jgi:hypothetical protein
MFVLTEIINCIFCSFNLNSNSNPRYDCFQPNHHDSYYPNLDIFTRVERDGDNISLQCSNNKFILTLIGLIQVVRSQIGFFNEQILTNFK